jgi:methyl-accepting chemotaxis protein
MPRRISRRLIQTSNGQVKTGATLVNAGWPFADRDRLCHQEGERYRGRDCGGVREQATGLEQINTRSASMDEMTQRNGALVEETSAAAQSLSNQAEELADAGASATRLFVRQLSLVRQPSLARR